MKHLLRGFFYCSSLYMLQLPTRACTTYANTTRGQKCPHR